MTHGPLSPPLRMITEMIQVGYCGYDYPYINIHRIVQLNRVKPDH